MSINRRKFIQQSALVGGALLTSSLVTGANEDNSFIKDSLTILHTNDVHSRLDPFPMDGSRNAGMGGVSARATTIRQIKQEVAHVLLLDSGDIFQGDTSYFKTYHGEPEIKAMSMMGYDACTMGEHDFDGGVENFSSQLRHATFPVLLCNYDFTNTPMENKSVPYKIFQKGNIKVGIFGVGIELKTLIQESLYGNTIYRDPVECANTTADFLKRHGCDVIICLSHLGDKYTDDRISDEILAKETYDIDLILGGHTHRFFSQPIKYRNKKNGDTLVNQVGWGGLQLGRLDYNFDRSKKKNLLKVNTVLIGGKIGK